MRFEGLQLVSRVDASGFLTIELVEATLSEPSPTEVIVMVEAAPINPSDLAMLLGPADLDTLEVGGTTDRPTLRASIPSAALGLVKARVDLPLTPGNEGAGVVVAAGADADDMLGKRVAVRGGGMFAQYRQLDRRDCVVLPEGVTAADGASLFINPLTALGFVETMKAEGHSGIVHFAAASNLGQMLNRICVADGIPLVNIVRSREQAAILRTAGARHVLDSSDPAHAAALIDALQETGATIAFDPIYGGKHLNGALAAMESAAARNAGAFNRYGTDTFKQGYIYGTLAFSPPVLERWIGFAWSVGGWLLTNRLNQLGPETVGRMQQRVLSELQTTFASHYSETVTLRDALRPELVRAYNRKGTGQKYLLSPSGA